MVYPVLSDLVNWSQYNQEIVHSKTKTTKLNYEENGVKIYSNNNFNIYIFNPKKVNFGV
jgi:hypothetical protein